MTKKPQEFRTRGRGDGFAKLSERKAAPRMVRETIGLLGRIRLFIDSLANPCLLAVALPPLDACCALGECLILPFLGLASLFWVQTCCDKTRLFAQRQFLITLVIVTVMTLRTVIECEPMWLIHTTTLGVMVIAAMFAPGHNPNTMMAHPIHQASAD